MTEHIQRASVRAGLALLLLVILGSGMVNRAVAQIIQFGDAISQTLPKVVKIVGSGGARGLEAYQSGILISSQGHVLTSWNYVLDSGAITLTLNDGYKYEADLIGFDPQLGIAVLKIPATETQYFNIDKVANAEAGDRVLAFSNLYNVATGNEPVSIQQGYISAVSKLPIVRGAWQSPYQGNVLLLDAMTNNPGATGGAVTDRHGQLVALIGKELRDGRTNAWLNYGIPIENLKSSVRSMIDGEKQISPDVRSAKGPAEPLTLAMLGVSLVPNIVKKTPPYVDRVAAGSSAERIGLIADDLIIEVNGVMTPSTEDVRRQLTLIDRDASVKLTVQRENRFLELRVSAVAGESKR